jgi:hypothetical protein
MLGKLVPMTFVSATSAVMTGLRDHAGLASF